METLDIVKTAVAALEDKKAEDITVIDITGVSSIADYFIIANGTNQNQLTAMQDAVDEAMYKAGLHAKQIEGNNQSTWILMDYQDIIVHLFSKEDRLFYDLERIWKDGKVIELSIFRTKKDCNLRKPHLQSFDYATISKSGRHRILYQRSSSLEQ